MDQPIVTQIFRQLFSHRVCSRTSYRSLHIPQNSRLTGVSNRHASNYTQDKRDTYGQSSWQQRSDIFPQDKSKDFAKYPMVTADTLRTRRERPRRVKMLMRDFIDDSLYNPHYGYFSTQAVIFSPGESFQFNSMKDEFEFHDTLRKRYTDFEDALDAKQPSDTRQLWHTPTELFRPYYGEAIARYLVANYKLSHHPYHDLIIYEMGAGNGTLMLNILDYIRDFHPDVYNRTQFKVIEISSALAKLQNEHLARTASSRGHKDHVEIINRSIFDWDTYVPSPCNFLALEVFDNFAHDAIRYDPVTEIPLQAIVMIDNEGEMYEFNTPDLDPVASHFLDVRRQACANLAAPYQHPLKGSKLWRNVKSRLPFTPNLTLPEFIPTRLMQFFEILAEYFPRHRLVAGDFNELPNAVQGYNAPVVQTRYQRTVVPVTTPLVHQGYFDILFPTDFAVTEAIYRAMTGKLTRVTKQEEFLRGWAFLEETRTRSGENPMLSWYKNASVLTTI